jgi:hypothetical protein
MKKVNEHEKEKAAAVSAGRVGCGWWAFDSGRRVASGGQSVAVGKNPVILRNRTRGRDIWCGMNRRLPKGAACFQPPTAGCAGGAQTFGKAAV